MLRSSPSLKPYASSPYTIPSVSAPRSVATLPSPRARRKTSLSASPRTPAPRAPEVPTRSQSEPSPRSPKRPTADASTQYTPPDWPPTSSRAPRPLTEVPIRRQHSETSQPEPVVAPSPVPKVADTASSQPQPPLEPVLRKTPQTSFSQSRSDASRIGSPVSRSDSGQPTAKRLRPPDQETRVVPRDYALCPPKTLAVLIAGLLMDLINHNDTIKLEDNNLTRFHSRTPPGISVYDYLQRLTFHATLPSPVLLAMVFYIDRLCAAFPIFTINSLTVHRFLITAVTVAAKGLCDVFWTNSLYAKVGGVSLKELALLELELLTRVEWRIIPETEKLGEYYRSVVERHPDYVLEDAEPSSSDVSIESMEVESPDGAG